MLESIEGLSWIVYRLFLEYYYLDNKVVLDDKLIIIDFLCGQRKGRKVPFKILLNTAGSLLDRLYNFYY